MTKIPTGRTVTMTQKPGHSMNLIGQSGGTIMSNTTGTIQVSKVSSSGVDVNYVDEPNIDPGRMSCSQCSRLYPGVSRRAQETGCTENCPFEFRCYDNMGKGRNCSETLESICLD